MRFVLLFSIFATAIYAEQNFNNDANAESKVMLASSGDVEIEYIDSSQIEEEYGLKFVAVGDDEFN